MSVKKCNDFLKFKPYLIGIFNSVNGNRVEFENTLQELLTPQAIIKAWDSLTSGQVEKPAPDVPVHNIRVIDRSKVTISKEDPSVEFTHSFSTPLERQRVEAQVVKDIVKKSLYDIDTKQSINSIEKINGHTLLNRNLFEYQKELLNNVRTYVGLDLITETIDELTDESWKEKVLETLTKFSTYSNDDSNQYKIAKSNYIVFKYFGEIISRNCKFLGFTHIDSNDYVLDRFKFDGANVQHYTGSIGSTETANLTDQVSDLAKVLLNSIPKVTTAGINIPGTSIGTLGFQDVATKIKNAIFYSRNKALSEYSKSLLTGASANFTEIFSVFLAEQNGNRIPTKYRITNINVLNGMYEHIFNNPNLDQNIQNMFKKMFLQSCNNQFMCYAIDPETNEFGLRSLAQVAVDNEARRFYDVVKCAALTLMNKTNKPYTVKDDVITIGDVQIKYNKRGNSIVKGEENIKSAIQTILNYTPYDGYDDTVKLLSHNGKINNGSINYVENSEAQIFTDLIVATITAVESSRNDVVTLTNELQKYWGRYRAVGEVNSTLLGTDVKNVIKNLEGNGLPAFNLPNLTWRMQEHIQTMLSEKRPDAISNQDSNLLLKGTGVKLEQAFVRNVVKINGKTKSASQATIPEILYLAIFQDYWKNLNEDKSLMFQPTTFSDKPMQFMHVFDISEDFYIDGKSYNLQSLLKQQAFDIIETIIQKLREKKYTKLKNNILADYNFVYGKNLKTFDDLSEFLKGKSAKNIRKDFHLKGKVAYDEIHFTETKAGLKVNETLYSFYNVFTNPKSFSDRLQTQKQRFIEQLKNENFIVPEQMVSGLDPDWVDEYGHVILEKSGKINPILEGYFLSDILLSGQIQDLLVGETFAHPSKYASKNIGKDGDLYTVYCEADRLIAQNKRAVIHGATYHMLLQKPDGVGPVVKGAVMKDITADIQTITGSRDDSLKTMDGSALASALFTRMMNNSLEDAKVGADMKTIFHSFVPEYGLQQLCKWATFALTNERRRMGYHSDTSVEKVHKKMHSIPIVNGWDGIVNLLTTTWNDKLQSEVILFQNPEQLTDYYRLTKIEYEDGVFTKHFAKFEDGQIVEGTEDVRYVDTKTVGQTLYTIESLFGGAFNYKYENNQIVPAETNLDVLEDVVKNFPEVKQALIGFVINSSAIKVGAGNINPTEAFTDDSELMTIELSTQFGGLQMDAEHELEGAHLNETTQLVSALEQLGYSHDIVTEIYTDIGKVAYDAIQDWAKATNEYVENPDKLYRLLGKALIDSFKSESRDTLGLAQSFVQIASSYINEANIKYRLPFSSNQINGIFVSTINSKLTSTGIRRKYQGIISVLTPSHSMMQYFLIDGKTYTYDQLGKLIKEKVFNLPENWKISDYITVPNLEQGVTKIISGGQTGVDTIGLQVAKELGISTGGTASKGFLRETGYDNENIAAYGLIEITDDEQKDYTLRTSRKDPYTARTELNVRNSDGTVYFSTAEDNRGLIATKRSADEFGKPFIENPTAEELKQWIIDNNIKTLNVAGNRGSKLKNPEEIKLILQQALQTVKFNNIENNPFIEQIDQWKDLDFGDTVIYETSTGIVVKRIDSFVDFDELRHYGTGRVFRHNLRPRDLKGQTLSFNVQVNDSTVSGVESIREIKLHEYDVPAIRAINYLSHDDWKTDLYKLDCIKNVVPTINVLQISVSKLKAELQKKVQEELDNIKVGNSYGEGVITKVHFKPAQIGMGKQNAKKYLLRVGDRLSDIKDHKFFLNRLRGVYDVDGMLDGEDYDFVIFDNDRQPLFVQVANKSDFNERFNGRITPSTDFQFVEDEVYYKNKLLGKRNQDFDYKSVTNANGEIVNIVRVNTWDDLWTFKNHTRFNIYKHHYNNRNVDSLHNYLFKDISNPYIQVQDSTGKWHTVKEATVPDEHRVAQLNMDVEHLLLSKITKLSQKMFESWQIQLKLIGTRIPSQAQQSFMPMELAFVTDSEINDVYVPKFQTFVEGSDYDIDKLFIIGWEISNTGLIITGSKLSETFNSELVLRLPLPKPRTFSFRQRFEDAEHHTIKEIHNIHTENQEEYIELLNKILRSDEDVLIFEIGTSEAFIEQVLLDLEIHNSTRLDRDTKTAALKNKVVAGIHRVISNPRNFISASSPVDDAMIKLKTYAAQSDAGKAAKFISTDNPFSKFMMQIENMSGKNVIGIGATGQKSFFAVTYVYNQIVRESILPNGQIDVSLLEHLLFTDPISNKPTTLVNLNVEALENRSPVTFYGDLTFVPTRLKQIGAVTEISPNTYVFDPQIFVNWVKQNSWNFDGATNISAIISAATDNAKELILKKLNCDQNFAGIYCYLTLIGHDFDDIASNMIHSNIGFISKISSSNIFLSETSKIKFVDAVNFLAGKDFFSFVPKSNIAYLLNELGYKNEEYTLSDLCKIFEVTSDKLDQLAEKIKDLVSVRTYAGDDPDYIEMYDFDGSSDYSEGVEQGEGPVVKTWTPETPTDNSVLTFLKYLKFRQYYIEQNTTIDEKTGNIVSPINQDLLTKIIQWKENSEELRILGQILKINQGLENKKYDMYKYISKIDNYINGQITEEIAKTLGGEAFSFLTFLSDQEYRQRWITNYEKFFRKSINILDIITRSPHFSEMLNILKVGQDVIIKSSVKNRFVQELIPDVVKANGVLTQPQYNKLDNFISDFLVYAWLSARNYTITLPAGTTVLNPATQKFDATLTKSEQLPLSGVFNLGTFKNFVETTIVPELKSNPEFSENMFVKMLTGGSKENFQRNRQVSTFTKLNLDLANVSTPQVQSLFEQVVSDFNKISTNKFYGWTLGDIFYLYNLLVNKDSFGANSMTRLFEQTVISGTTSNLVNDYNHQLSIWDKFGISLMDLLDESDINFDLFIKDILFNIATPESYWLLKTSIQQNDVQYEDGSRIATDALASDVTFNFPNISKCTSATLAKQQNKNIRTKMIQEYESYNTIVTGKIGEVNVIGNFVEFVKRNYPQIPIEYMDEEEIKNNPTTNGFIKDGITYINPNAGLQAALHEITHIVLAVLKETDLNKYYTLVDNAVDSEAYQRILNSPELYGHLKGADVKEEALVAEFTNYLSGKISKWGKIHEIDPEQILTKLFELDTRVNSELLQLLSTNDFRLLNGILNEVVLQEKQDTIQLILSNNQKVLTLKSNWIKDGTIEANCK